MNTKEETIERMLIEFHKGNYHYFPYLVEECLDMVVEEIGKHPETPSLSLAALLALFCSIKSYNREKQGHGYSYIQQYIHLTLLVYRGNPVKLNLDTVEIYFPTYGIHMSTLEIQKYHTIIQEKMNQRQQDLKKNELPKTFKISLE